MHILKTKKNLIFVRFWSSEVVVGQMCVDIQLLMHIMKPKNFSFVD